MFWADFVFCVAHPPLTPPLVFQTLAVLGWEDTLCTDTPGNRDHPPVCPSEAICKAIFAYLGVIRNEFSLFQH